MMETETRLADISVKIGSGSTPQGGQKAYLSSGIPLIRSQNIHLNRFEDEGLAFISHEQDKIMAGSRVEPGDVLLNITGASIGRVCVVPENRCPANVNQHVCIIRSDGSWIPDYLSLFLSSPDFQDFISASQAGATRQALTKSMVSNFKIPLPDLKTQKQIARRLREQMAEVDKAREALERQLAAADALRNAFLRNVFESKQITKCSAIPLYKVADIDSMLVDPTLKQYQQLPHISGVNMEIATGTLSNIRTVEEDGAASSNYHFREGVVLYSKLRPYLRKAAVANFEGLCSADMYPIQCSPSLHPRFLLWTLLSDSFTRYAESASQRSRMPKLNREQLFRWEIPLPSVEIQRKLANQIDTEVREAQHLRVSLQAQLTETKKLPAALLREVFGGGTEK